MTRNPANSANADDSWEQLEADLFGIEVGKEHTAEERVASEPAPPAPQQVVVSVPKPVEDDDFGDFGSGLVETDRAESSRPSGSRTRPKPVKAAEPEPAKPLPVEPVRGFDLADLDEGPTDEELDAASDEEEEDETEEEGAAATGTEEDPYWDALANWNWQEEDRSGKSRPESGRDRSSRASGAAGRGEGGQRGSRGRSGERRPPGSRESRPVSAEDRGHAASRRPSHERDRDRVDEVSAPVSEAAELERESVPVVEEHPHAPADVKSRRQDRRRSRRHAPPAAPVSDEAGVDRERVEELEELVDEGWPASADVSRSAPVESPRSRALPAEDEFEEEEVLEEAEGLTEAAGEEERAPRRRRRRRRRRPDRAGSVASESAADEDIKHLEEESFEASEEEELEEEPGAEELADVDRPSRSRRPRRRRRGGRGERAERPARPAPAPAARVERDFDDEDEEEAELVDSQIDDEFDEDQDREFVEEDRPARSGRRPSRARRSGSETPFVRHVEDEDEDDSEPEPAVSYEDVPSWEEAISYLLNPSMVEGAGGERPERGGSSNDRGHRGGDRSSRPPRRGPRRDRDRDA